MLAKKSLLYAGSFGFGAWLCGLVFVDRSNPQKAKQTLKDAVERLHKEKVCPKNLTSEFYVYFLRLQLTSDELPLECVYYVQ